MMGIYADLARTVQFMWDVLIAGLTLYVVYELAMAMARWWTR